MHRMWLLPRGLSLPTSPTSCPPHPMVSPYSEFPKGTSPTWPLCCWLLARNALPHLLPSYSASQSRVGIPSSVPSFYLTCITMHPPNVVFICKGLPCQAPSWWPIWFIPVPKPEHVNSSNKCSWSHFQLSCPSWELNLLKKVLSWWSQSYRCCSPTMTLTEHCKLDRKYLNTFYPSSHSLSRKN